MIDRVLMCYGLLLISLIYPSRFILIQVIMTKVLVSNQDRILASRLLPLNLGVTPGTLRLTPSEST